MQIPADESTPSVQQPSDEDEVLNREMDYLVEPEEAEARGITEVDGGKPQRHERTETSLVCVSYLGDSLQRRSMDIGYPS